MPLRVMILEDQQLLRDLMVKVVNGRESMVCAGDFATLREAQAFLAAESVDMVILDLHLPDGSGMDLIRSAQKQEARIVIVTGQRDSVSAREALLQGVDAFISKEESFDVLLTGFTEVAAGRPYYSPMALGMLNPMRSPADQEALSELTSREREVLVALARSETIKETAARCGIAAPTVKTHRLNVMRKLGIHDVAGLTRYAVAQGLVRSTD